MIYALTSIPSRIRHHPIPVGVQSLLGGHFGCKGEQPTQQPLSVLPLGVTNGGDMLCRDNQHVHRRSGIDIPKGQRVGGSLDDGGRDITSHDLAEQAVSHAVPAFWLD